MNYLISILLVVMAALPAQASLVGNSGVKMMEYVYDYSVDGGATGFIDLADEKKLPAGADILRVSYYVEVAPTSSGSATIGVGDSGSNARYQAATAYNNAAYADEGVFALSTAIPNHVDSAAEGKFGIVIATAVLTAGKIHFYVEFAQHKE